MKLLLLIIIVFAFLFTGNRVFSADVEDASKCANKFYTAWSNPTIDSETLLNQVLGFDKFAPVEIRAAVLSLILDRAVNAKPKRNYRVITRVLIYLGNPPNFKLTSETYTNLKLVAKDSDWKVRRKALQALRVVYRPQDSDIFILALQDPNDEIRSLALPALIKEPASYQIYTNYVYRHKADASYLSSVGTARDMIEYQKEHNMTKP